MKFFYKNEVCRRVFSMITAFVMIFTMFAAQLPEGLLEVRAAENEMNITVHFDNSVYHWETPAIQFWGGSLTVSDYAAGPTEIQGWNNAVGYTLVQEENNWYSVTLTGACDGFQFLDLSNPSNNTGGKGYNSYMTQYTAAEAVDLYFKPYEDNYNGKWYTDIECMIPLSAPADTKTYDVTLHWYNEDNWSAVNIWAWNGTGNLTGGTWPGQALTENSEHTGWYDVMFENLTESTFYYIFSAGADSAKTADLSAELDENGTELWITGGYANPVAAVTAPDSWNQLPDTPDETFKGDVTLTVHYKKPAEWSAVNLYTWNPETEAKPNGIWPGTGMKADTNNAGWYYASGLFMNASKAGYIFNSESGQTADAFIDFTSDTMQLWVDGSSVSTTAPEGWTYTQTGGEVTETSNLYVRDVMEVKIGDNIYPMNVFSGGVFETVVALEAGIYHASLMVNGVEAISTAPTEIKVENAGKTAIRLTDEGLTASPVEFVALAGNIDTLSNAYVNWNPSAQSGQLTYLGNGLYRGTFEFEELKQDTEIEYKIVFGGNWGGKEISDNGQNIKTVIPAGRSTFAVLVDAKAGTVINDVNTTPMKVNGADRNPITTTVSLIGTVRGLGGDDWNAGKTGYEFTRISDTLYRYEMILDKGTYSYKAVFDYNTWYEIEGMGNRMITLTKDDVKVVFLYDITSGYLFDTVNNEEKAASLLGMKVKPADMEIIENANGTVTFVAVAKDGERVTLYYGEKAEVEEKGTDALTKVAMGTVSNGKSSSEALWLGDAATDLVYYYEINGVRTLDGSKPTVIVGAKEYSNYARPEYKGRVINVPGTFPGPSWDAASNQMTYNGNRIYSYTFKNTPAAKYEFKIAVNGSWAENYGADGAFDGGNMKVSVPAAQDVTIYYSDVTHYAVNSIDYKFASITLTGTNIPEGTKLTDEGLTGIYAVTLTLPAGTYSDLLINCDGKESNITEFRLDEEKAVTFCMDPVTGLFYHNASDIAINEDAIYYNSKDTAYKSVFGAIATDEEVVFRLTTGTDISSASFIIKGNENKSVAMTKEGAAEDGIQKWSATISLSAIGEYTYYFAVSNGSGVKVYGDDDGYYGTGKTDELTNVKPYDLVVYQSGFETPDWMKNAVIYQIFPDRFYDGDAANNHAQESARGDVDYEFIDDWYTLPENPEQEGLLDKNIYESTGAHWGDGQWSNEIYGGDLEGITERIDYLKALGVTVIYLNPVFSSISNHRYDACDYTKIDPILGTEGDFAELVEVAEQNGMKVVLDGVFNHVSDDSIYFDRYYKFIDDGLETIGAYPYWAFVYDYMAENDVDEARAEEAAKTYFTAEYGITDYSYTEWFDVFKTTMKDDAGKEVYDTIGQRTDKPVYGYDGWWGYDSMPIIKATNGSEYQTGNWAEEIIYNEDGTSVTQYWISQGTDGWRLDVANEVSDETWQRFRESVKALNDGDAVIIGEIWDDATKYIIGDMYDSVMNYMFRNAVTAFAKGTDAAETTKYMERLRERYPEEAFYAMMNLVGSHDTTRILSYLDGIDDDRNQKDINSAFPTYENTSEDAKQRQYLVAFLQFTYAGAPTIYYGDEIGMVGSDDPDDRRAFEWGKGNKELVTYYATLAAVRNSYSALRTGSVETFDAGDNHVLAYIRRDAANELIVLANNSASAVTVTLDLADLNVHAEMLGDLLDENASYDVSENKVTVTVAARRGVILADEQEMKEIEVNEKALEAAYDEKYVVPEVSKRPVDTPEKPNTPNIPAADDVEEDSDNSASAVPLLPSVTIRPGSANRPEYTEDDEVNVIEDIELPSSDTQTEDAEEEKEAADEKKELAEEEVPLAADAGERNVLLMITILAVLLAACGSVVMLQRQKKQL